MPLSGEICDVLVIGGGPAGATAAALLAARGVDVVLLEKDAHPRFHIGESLLPRNLPLFERLGVAEKIAAIGVHKPGAEFICDEMGGRVAFPFALSRVKGFSHAYQVRRAEFDQILFENARAKGARLRERVRVVAVAAGAGERLSVRAESAGDGALAFAPRFVLDASGRETFLASRLGLKETDKHNNTAAVFAHFRGVSPRRDDMAGAISIHFVRDGWLWVIPLPEGLTSIGFVGTAAAFKGRNEAIADFFLARLRESPSLWARMGEAARVSPVTSTGNYSYRARRAWGDRWLLIGDAFAFLDPVFSSGVLLAMTMAEQGAETALAWLADPARGAQLARRQERQIRAALDRIGWMIHRINTPVLRELFLAPRNTLGMRDAIISLLAGHVRPERGMAVPVLAFKSIYYALAALRRLSPRPPRPAR